MRDWKWLIGLGLMFILTSIWVLLASLVYCWVTGH